MPRIQFLTFDGCPFAETARTRLEYALERCGLPATDYETIDVLDPDTDSRLTGWSSPTILVNGVDIYGLEPSDGVGCRLYFTADRAPAVDAIVAAIRLGSSQ